MTPTMAMSLNSQLFFFLGNYFGWVATGALAVGGLLLWAVKIYIEKKISTGVAHNFSKHLEKYRHDLSIEVEKARTNFQAELADINLYLSRKHESIEKVFTSILVAHGAVTGLLGFAHSLTFQEYNGDDIWKYMEKRRFPKGKREEILSFWDTDRRKATAILEPYSRMFDVQNARRKLDEATNQMLLGEIYLTDDIIAKSKELFKNLTDWLIHCEMKDFRDDWTPDRDRLQKQLDGIKTALKSHLNLISK